MDLVPELRRRFKVLELDGALEPQLQGPQVRGWVVDPACLAQIELPDVLRRSVNASEQATELTLEVGIALRTPEPAGVTEVLRGGASVGAGLAHFGARRVVDALPDVRQEIS